MDAGSNCKVFSDKDYEQNKIAYDLIRSKMSDTFDVVLRNEDYQIDCVVYSKASRGQSKRKPLFYIELEMRKNLTHIMDNEGYINFFAKKQKHLKQKAIPFWIVADRDLSDAIVVPMPVILTGELTSELIQAYDQSGYKSNRDNVYKVHSMFCKRGLDNLDSYILEYMCEFGTQSFVHMFKIDKRVGYDEYDYFDVADDSGINTTEQKHESKFAQSEIDGANLGAEILEGLRKATAHL